MEFCLQQIKKSEAVGLLALASMLVFIYLIWLLLTVRYHCQVGSQYNSPLHVMKWFLYRFGSNGESTIKT